ncbi:hypothetical protein NC99_35560 [Sunxiuqinia dokdonensis]|uniref:Uncharacterized protein n=1 Tax=Sunxiuqinia dokdonensis TaxID=1409788 RepID=A0A0L8V5E3_9BACT|nr:hypothetical protein NC99_35560 [Sunxiuqinia dokdonensis]
MILLGKSAIPTYIWSKKTFFNKDIVRINSNLVNSTVYIEPSKLLDVKTGLVVRQLPDE